jgi:hypothetical protein
MESMSVKRAFNAGIRKAEWRTTSMATLTNSFLVTLGRCPRCMRSSFAAAATAGLIAGLAAALTGPSYLAAFPGAVALGLTGLWLAHVAAFAARATRQAVPVRTSLTRRHALLGFAQSFVFAVAAASLPQSAARAAQTCQACSTGQSTCLKGCESLPLLQQPQCQKACVQQWPCVPGRDCQ